MKTTTTPYEVAEHLRTRDEMAANLEACIEEAHGDAAFIAKVLGDIARDQGMTQVPETQVFPGRAYTRPCLENAARALTPS